MTLRLAIGAMLCSIAWAQGHTHGYAFGAVTGVPGESPFTFWGGTYVQGGAGFEAGIGSRFTAGGEAAALISTRDRLGRHAAILSGGAAFHFLERSKAKVDPFVGAGVSLLVSNGVGGMWYFAGGVNYWFRDRIGFRAEFRDHVWSEGLHFASARFGLSFR